MQTRGEGMVAGLRAVPALTAATAVMYGCGAVLLVASAISWQPGRNPRWVITSLAVLAVVFFTWTLVRGHRFSRAEALAMTVVHVASIGGLTWTTPLQLGAFANGTALPIVAVYALWFLPPVHGRVVLYAGTAWWMAAILHRPDPTLVPFAASLVVQTIVAAEVLGRIKQRMDRVARVDPLTGAHNLRGITEVLEREMARAERRGEPLSVAAVDLDGLRTINNTQGHRAGDELLVTVARHWQDGVRRRDAVGRTGGDEFLFVLPSTAKAEAERIVRRLAATSRGSWSAGVAELKPGDTLASMLERADQRMYVEKATRQHT
jgi:diguanylate cyclase (GGDEF)-like protein